MNPGHVGSRGVELLHEEMSGWPGWAEIRHTLSMRGDGSTLRILGPVELIGPAGPVRLGAAKERCLLAVLALHLGEAVSQDQLAEALWGENAPRSATNALQNYVLRLRRALQHADGVQILTDPAGYRLEAPADVVDARLAEGWIAEGREAAASGDPAAASRLLARRWRCGPGGRWWSSPTSRSPRRKLRGWRSCASRPARTWSTPSWPSATITRRWGSLR